MARIIQIRRGTSAEHENFTGAIGEITMDTDAKKLRVHDGETVGGIPVGSTDAADYIVDYKTGLSDTNYTNGWYRKYKSGWVEQGANVAAGYGYKQIVFPVPMSDNNYTLTSGVNQNNAQGVSQTGVSVRVQNASATGFEGYSVYNGTQSSGRWSWRVAGFAAN